LRGKAINTPNRPFKGVGAQASRRCPLAWIYPLAWTMYGLIVTQYVDLEDPITVPSESKQMINYYVTYHFGYHRDFMPVVAHVLVLFATFLAFMYVVYIKRLNFQQ
jgi:hypothetical protein